MAEVVPGRIHARAIFEKVKSFYVNFLLINHFHFLPITLPLFTKSVQGFGGVRPRGRSAQGGVYPGRRVAPVHP